MKTIQLIQGSEQWHQHRANHFNASDAPVMLGLSSYRTRDELLQEKKTGISPEINEQTQKIFDLGHKYESMARPYAEKIIDDDLFPVTGVEEIKGLPLSASFDGLTMLETICFEHKSINDKLRGVTCIEELDEQYKAQMEQQLMVCGGDRCLFMASKGETSDMISLWYEPDPVMRKRIITGWKQFSIDLEVFEPTEKTAPIKTAAIEALPALIVNVAGEITTTNIDDFKTTALAFINNINTDLQTDTDFANAETTIKFCTDAEKQIKAVKQQAVDQMADVSQLFKTMDFIAEELRQTRLMLNKSVTQEKENRKREIVAAGRKEIDDFLCAAADRLEGHHVRIDENFAGAIKGKRALDSMRSAINDEVAQLKIAISEQEVVIRVNLDAINALPVEHKNLFPDLGIVVQKDNDDVKMIVENRVNKFNDDVKREAQRVEDLRIEAERLEAERVEDLRIEAERLEAERVEDLRIEAERLEAERVEAKRIEQPVDAQPELIKKHIEKPNELSPERVLCDYADDVQAAIQNMPLVEDKKLKAVALRVQKKLLKAVDELYIKLQQDKAA
jgi:putative phage-type endonuclease